MGFTSYTFAELQLLGSTGPNAVALVNGTPNLFSWTAPNDGQMHRVMAFGVMHVTVAQTGGAVAVAYTDPDGNSASWQIWGGGFGTGTFQPNIFAGAVVGAGSVVTVKQLSAQTLGAATVRVELWGA